MPRRYEPWLSNAFHYHPFKTKIIAHYATPLEIFNLILIQKLMEFFGYLPFWRLLHQWGFVLLWDFVFDHSLVLVCIRPFQASDKFPQGIRHDNQLYIQFEFHWTFPVFLKNFFYQIEGLWRTELIIDHDLRQGLNPCFFRFLTLMMSF